VAVAPQAPGTGGRRRRSSSAGAGPKDRFRAWAARSRRIKELRIPLSHRNARRLLLESAHSPKAGLFLLNQGIKGKARSKNAIIKITDDIGRFKKIKGLPSDKSKD
jgi:hypothetical protein